MDIVKIPNLQECWDQVEVKYLSPSTFTSVDKGCSYRLLLQKCIQSMGDKRFELPNNQSSILGTIIHKIYELASKGQLCNIKDMISFWDNSIAEAKENLISLYPTLRNTNLNDYDKRNKAIKYALGIMNAKTVTGTNSASFKIYNEKYLDCPSIKLRGFADKIVIRGDKFDIVDYKSGNVFDDDGNIKKDYLEQLHLYAAMCEKLGMGETNALMLVDIEGVEHEVEFNRTMVNLLLSDVQREIDNLNKVISKRDFKSIIKSDNAQCGSCCCRHICKHRTITEDSLFSVIDGTLVDIRSSNLYVLESEGKRYFISGLKIYDISNENNYIGKHLVFVNVIKNSGDSDTHFKITDYTILYELD